jgi:hypothetical protein
MPIWKPDPTFYPSPRLAMQAPPEELAFVAAFDSHGTSIAADLPGRRSASGAQNTGFAGYSR